MMRNEKRNFSPELKALRQAMKIKQTISITVGTSIENTGDERIAMQDKYSSAYMDVVREALEKEFPKAEIDVDCNENSYFRTEFETENIDPELIEQFLMMQGEGFLIRSIDRAYESYCGDVVVTFNDDEMSVNPEIASRYIEAEFKYETGNVISVKVEEGDVQNFEVLEFSINGNETGVRVAMARNFLKDHLARLLEEVKQ